MSIDAILTDLGDDAILLTRNDAWLNEELRVTRQEIDSLKHKVRVIEKAKKIKIQLQQQNKVVTQKFIKDNIGNIINIGVEILDIPDAITFLNNNSTTVDQINRIAQLVGWHKDGFDIQTSSNLRKNNAEK